MALREHLERHHLLLGGIVVVGIALRLWGLGAESIWFDESVSANFASNWSFNEILFQVPVQDPHPPLYYLLLKGWTMLVGASEVGLRSLSVLADLGSILLIYGIGRTLFDRRAGLIAALLFALSPFYLWYAQEARMYALVSLLALASYYSLLGIVANEERPWRNGWTYVLSTVAMCLTHALAPLIVVAQNVYLADGLGRRGYVGGLLSGRWLKLQVLVAVATVPYYFELFYQTFVIDRLITYVQWIPEASPERLWEVFGMYVGRSLPTAPPGSVSDLWFDVSLLGEAVTILALTVVVTVVVRSVRRDRDPGPQNFSSTLMLVAWFGVPLVGIYVLSKVVTPLLVARYTAPAGVAVLLLLARGLTMPFEFDDVGSMPSAPGRQTVLAAGVVGLVLAAPILGVYDAPQKQQWREATELVEGNATAGDAVLVTPFWSTQAYEYYATRTDLEVIGLRAEPISGIQQAVEGSEHVWLLRLDATDSITQLRALIQRLGFNRQSTTDFHNVTVYRYERG